MILLYIYFTIYIYINAFLIFFCRSKVNKGIGIENCHYLNDGLWQMKPVK